MLSPKRGSTIGRAMAITTAAIKYFQKESMNNPAPNPIMNQMTAIIVSLARVASMSFPPLI
jgi:hypothetical protein